VVIVFFSSVLAGAQQFASVPGQGLSMVVSKFGIVSTPQFLASQAGAHILEEGGNAIDAAIAANALMGAAERQLRSGASKISSSPATSASNSTWEVNGYGETQRPMGA